MSDSTFRGVYVMTQNALLQVALFAPIRFDLRRCCLTADEGSEIQAVELS